MRFRKRKKPRMTDELGRASQPCSVNHTLGGASRCWPERYGYPELNSDQRR